MLDNDKLAWSEILQKLILSARSKDILEISVSGNMSCQKTSKSWKQLVAECVKHAVPFLLCLLESSSLWNLAWLQDLVSSLKGGYLFRSDLCQFKQCAEAAYLGPELRMQ